VANTKEIKNKIKSIKSTQKITKAMEMVAASKMRRAQDRMFASRPYSSKVREVIAHLANGQLEDEHPYLTERETRRVGIIVVSTDRGLCGGLNTNLFRVALELMQTWVGKQIEVALCAIGNKAETFFKRHHRDHIIASTAFLGDIPMAKAVIGPVKVLLDAYDEKKLDKIFFVYNEFVNTMVQKPKVEMLLPIVKQEDSKQKDNNGRRRSDYIYEQQPKILLDALLKRYVESLVYQGLVENAASEQAARMVAMKNASDNAGDLIDEFQLMYNKARQAAITKELAEIVAGAAAV
jgi:F-type H+-transporting ATPase subunit gamma